jgi:hypothetical protein
MLTFWGVVTMATVFGGIPTVSGLWLFERWRSRRRNRKGECAVCGTFWSLTKSGDPFLIHGRLVCEGCGEKARRRLPWHLGFLGLAAGIATAGAVSGAGLAAIIFLPAGATVAMTVGAIQLMKHANRNAQRRIAAGEFPDMERLRSDEVIVITQPEELNG